MRASIVGALIVLAVGGCSNDGDHDPPGEGTGRRDHVVDGGGPGDSATSDDLTLSPGRPSGTVLTGTAPLAVAGDTPVSTHVERLSGGALRVVPGPSRTLPTAVSFPDYVAAGRYPRAVLRVTPTSGGALSPGAADFEYGAVFRLDASSSGRLDDNGDNVFQRGLSGDSSMLKLEVDHGRPACKIHGDQGVVVVRSGLRITRGRWYDVRCSRVGTTVTVRTAPYGSGEPVLRSTSRATGTITFAPDRPASVGGKLTRSGDIVAQASDQFNGAIAKVWIRRPPTTAQADPG